MQITTPQAIEKARALRKKMTDAELVLWSRLRGQQLGVKFRKQSPIGHYIVDFYCHGCLLVVELDGSQHLEQAEYDAIRTAYLNSLGIQVLRYWNHEVLQNIDVVVADIFGHLHTF